jgi:DNA-binding response OmpR family regulator
MSALICPCCSQVVTSAVRDPSIVLALVHLSPLERKIAGALARRFGRWWSPNDLVDAVYADDVDGGPETARTAIAVHIATLRRRLARTPLTIEGMKGSGGGRRMVWRDAA